MKEIQEIRRRDGDIRKNDIMMIREIQERLEQWY